MSARGLVVGAPRSGSGKTTLVLAIARAAMRRGLRVRVAKAGPDYIDPAFHAAATGAACPNLDGWAMPPPMLDAIMGRLADAAELVIVETAMGLFDGVEAAPGRSGAGAELAARWGLPVLLVLDVSGQSQSAAAVARGFATHRADVRLGGVVLNRVGSERHRAQVAQAMAAVGVPVLGSVGREAAVALPERHLGLVQAGEHGDLPARLAGLAELAERALDMTGVLGMAAEFAPGADRALESRAALPPPGQRIAVARDAAFSFMYPHVAEGWRAAGAEIAWFSPLADEAPDPACDCCWLPGGYPELHAGVLAAAGRFGDGMRRFAGRVHGECGGFMVLGEALEDADGVTHGMLGLLGHRTSFARRKLNLGYRAATLLADAPIGRAGDVIRGHEFHYAVTTQAGGDAALAELRDAAGRSLGAAGGWRGRVSGSFFHAIAAQ